MKPTPPYPFKVSPHAFWIFQQLTDTPRIHNLDSGEKFVIQSFDHRYPPSTEYDYNTSEIMQYLELNNVLRFDRGWEGVESIPLPLPGKPHQTMVTNYTVSIRNGLRLREIAKNVAYRLNLNLSENTGYARCRFILSRDGVFTLRSSFGDYALQELNFGMSTYKVVSTLCKLGEVELDADGKIVAGEFSGTKVNSLHEVLRGLGFDKFFKDQIFSKSAKNHIKLPFPDFLLNKQLHDELIILLESSKRKNRPDPSLGRNQERNFQPPFSPSS